MYSLFIYFTFHLAKTTNLIIEEIQKMYKTVFITGEKISLFFLLFLIFLRVFLDFDDFDRVSNDLPPLNQWGTGSQRRRNRVEREK